jgi:hypothetical protein
VKVNNFRGLLFLFLLFFLFYSVTNLIAEEGDNTSSDTPVPYERDEFPEWAHDLRRAEIIFIGSFPITFLFSSIGYDVIRFAANGFSREYAPALLNNPTTVPLSNGERLGVVLTSLGISAVIALVDFIIGTGEE